MFCAGRPSLFGAMPGVLEINPSWGRNGNGPWGSHPMMGLVQEVLVNGSNLQELFGRNQPNCVDHSGRRHCRTHCHGHSNPEDLLEQFIIEDTIRDAHQTSNNDNGHQCKTKNSECNETKTSEFSDKEKHMNKQEDVINRSLPNDTMTNQSTPWSVSVDMNGCEEVRARIEENKIVVEGQTRNTQGFMTVKRVMTLPSHVKGEDLTASLGRNGTLTLTEAQTSKENQFTDIPVSKNNTLQDSSTDQSENESAQDDSVGKDISAVNVNESDPQKKLNKDDNVQM